MPCISTSAFEWLTFVLISKWFKHPVIKWVGFQMASNYCTIYPLNTGHRGLLYGLIVHFWLILDAFLILDYLARHSKASINSNTTQVHTKKSGFLIFPNFFCSLYSNPKLYIICFAGPCRLHWGSRFVPWGRRIHPKGGGWRRLLGLPHREDWGVGLSGDAPSSQGCLAISWTHPGWLN